MQWRGSSIFPALLSKAQKFAVNEGVDSIGVGIRKSNTVLVDFLETWVYG